MVRIEETTRERETQKQNARPLDHPLPECSPSPNVVSSLTGERVEVKGYVDLNTTFGEGEHRSTIKERYLVVDSVSVYNVVIGRPALNALGAIVSTPHLTMKYPAANGNVGVVRADLEMASQCYNNTVKSST